MKILVSIVIVVAVLVSIGAILHSKYFKRKKVEIKPYGKMIDIFDGQMHVNTIGKGEKTIVLLPGMGVALPSADFGPLMRSLSESNYTVVCVEYFGVGFSSETKRPRTCENYVEEIRTALSKSGIKGPYVLMPHSISSVYSEYYASKYPDEVEAIISLDGTSTAYIGADMPSFVKSLVGIAKLQQKTGLTSILAKLTTNKRKLASLGYSEKEINDLIYYAGFVMNDTLLDQMTSSTEVIKAVNEFSYPDTVPYFKVISKKTYETKNSQLKISPQEYQHEHLARIGEKVEYEILEGTHFIYLNNVERITKITEDFLLRVNKSN